jgi:hypothetical protein
MQPRTFETGTTEYKRLEAVAKMLEALSAHNATYEVKEIYFDYGQRWMWTTICRKGYMECQVLNPKEWELIVSSTTTSALANACDEIRNSKYFHDK